MKCQIWFCQKSPERAVDPPFLGLLQIAARVAEELVLLAEHFARAELAQARRHGRVLLDVDRQVQEGLVPRRDGLTRQTSRLTGENALEQSVDEGADELVVRRITGG